ncbi:MAG: 2-dehydropantoate 2-reductase [Desulfobulbus sp.]|jgi:2-dehydropantoate 2-reductase|uniref:ketopantoate reductase family protein n=1 Tax=Desulfobulbus sp. TaxID=895 RepID=UPI002844B0D9|nr:2-dehydropantoate 2-reductase [Desulfobulbus sp.]MDR2548674.1 2-dehydropantoate 2-reductase [Desulfobulbus sp.]
MEILIIGAGAMGGLFASLLAPHARVCLLTTNVDHARAINARGLMLTAMDGSVRTTTVTALSEPEGDDRRADLVLICTKARATEAAAATAGRFLAKDGLALTLQNGLGNLERLAMAVGADRSAAGVTSQAATLLAPGHVRHAGRGPTVLGRVPGQAGRLAAVAELFNRAGIDTEVADDVDALLWSKLMVNVGVNALAALLRVPNGALLLAPECGALMAEAVAEAEAVAGALGIKLPEGRQADRVEQVCALTAANRASMLQDILRGAPTEIDAINGAIAAKGHTLGIPTPVNQLLTRLIKALEATASHRIESFSSATSPQESPCTRKS